MQFDLHELELPVRLRTGRPTTDDELIRFSSVNEPLRIEQESSGDLVVMSPRGVKAGEQTRSLRWNSGCGLGRTVAVYGDGCVGVLVLELARIWS